MGIHGVTAWKKILRDEFPECWRVARKKTFEGFSIVVEDLMLRMYKYANTSPSRSNLVTWWQSHPEFVFNKFPKARMYYALFDDSGRSPKAKKPEQRKRDAQKPSLTDQDMKDLGDSAYLCNDASDDMSKFNGLRKFGQHDLVKTGKKTAFQIFLELYLATREMREDALKFAHYNLIRFPPPKGKVVVVDGGATMGKQTLYRLGSEESREVPVIGEADIKILRVLKDHPEEDVWFTSADSDSIIILLLAIGHLMTAEGRVGRRIYLDMGHMTSDKRDVLDVVGLWRSILKRASLGGPWYGIKNPVETFCMLLICTGTDYVPSAPGVGPSTLWKTFMSKQGRALLSRSISVRGERHLILRERRLARFMRLTYYHAPNSPLPNHIQRVPSHADLSTFYNRPLEERYDHRKTIYERKMEAVRNGSYRGKKNPPKPREPKPALTESEVQVRVRTIGWNVFYWLEGYVRDRDTSLDKDEFGVSRFGWTLSQEGLVVLANKVSS